MDMASTHEERMSHMCDFGMPQHPAMRNGEDYLICTQCHAFICAECSDPNYDSGGVSNEPSSPESNSETGPSNQPQANAEIGDPANPNTGSSSGS